MSSLLRKIQKKLEERNSVYFAIQKFYSPKDKKHKELLKELVNELKRPCLKEKDGSLTILFLLKKRLRNGSITCECCQEKIGIFEHVTGEELKRNYPLFWNALLKHEIAKGKQICLDCGKENDCCFEYDDGMVSCFSCSGFSKQKIEYYKERAERIKRGESPPIRLWGNTDLNRCLICQKIETTDWKDIKENRKEKIETIFVCKSCWETKGQAKVIEKVKKFQIKWELEPLISYKSLLRNQEEEVERKRRNFKENLKRDLNLEEKDIQISNCSKCGEEVFGFPLPTVKSVICLECRGYVICNRQSDCRGNELVKITELINSFRGKEKKIVKKYLGKWYNGCQLSWVCDKCRRDNREDIPLLSLSFQASKDPKKLSEIELRKIIPQELKDFLTQNYLYKL